MNATDETPDNVNVPSCADRLTFRVLATDGYARRGQISTPRGIIRTPAFMPVGTAGTVKAMFTDTVRSTGADILLGNTYHLMLRPGAERVAALGGLHRFMNWARPILTDSGGFQVMSLSSLRRLSEDGVVFRSHIDGSEHHLTPERAVEIQCLLGADIQMQLDECIGYPADHDRARAAIELSLRWAVRAKSAFERQHAPGMALFGIVQGGVFADLRQISAETLAGLDLPGYALGGLAVGEGHAAMLEVLEATMPHMPQAKPRYLMGVGTPRDIIEAVARGIDMFDCVMPTRSGRHGQAFTLSGKLNLRNAVHAADPRPLDEESSCPAARDYSRAYLHHLFKAGEYLGPMLVSWANIHFYQDLMEQIRNAISERTLDTLIAQIRSAYPLGGDDDDDSTAAHA